MGAPAKLDTLQTIELAEGVQILLRPAGPLPRALALMIDMLMCGLYFALAFLIFLLVGRLVGFELGVGVLLLMVFTIYWGYFVLYEVLRKGQTPGKKYLGLRVVRSSGARVGWGASIMRNLVRFADMMPLLPQWQLWVLAFGFYLFGVTSCLATRRFQRLGDLVADTLVVYDRSNVVDVSAALRVKIDPSAPGMVLTREEQLAFTQFAERAATWSDSRKEELAKPLAPVIGVGGREGVLRALGIGLWIRDS